MKTSTFRRSIQLTLGSALLALGSSVWAASTWNFSNTGGCSQNATNANNFGNSWNCSATGGSAPALTATAWSTTGSGSTYAAANLPQYGGSGFGVQNTTESLSATSPNHSMDSANQVDLVSLKFGSSVKLDSVTIGWSSTDSDISVLAYTGPGVQPASIAGKSIATLLTSGWTLVGSYANLVSGTAKAVTNATNISSSWWLVSAYNSGFGSSSNSSSASLLNNGNDDYVKLLSVAATTVGGGTGQVSEPATIALFGLALLGTFAARRRKNG